MKISTKVRYGLRFLMDLAMHENTGNVKLKDIAHRQGISGKYLWQVVTPLKSAGLIRTVAGPGGGYQLTQSPSAVTLHDLLSILEGDGGLVDCTPASAPCERASECAARMAWAALDKALASEARSINLGDLVAKQRELESNKSLNYVI